MSIVGPKTYVAPNGETKMRIYHHGKIEPVTEISKEQGELIQDMSFHAADHLGPEATPFEVFEFMGWRVSP